MHGQAQDHHNNSMDNEEKQMLERWLGVDETHAAEAQALRLVICDPDGHDNMKTFASLGISSSMFMGMHSKRLWSFAGHFH